MKRLVCAALLVTAVDAAPARACSTNTPDEHVEQATFANRTLPLNARLTIVNRYNDSYVDGVVLIDPAGDEVAASIEPGVLHPQVLPARPLTPGAWRFRDLGRDDGNDVPFTVTDDIDDTAPAPARIIDSTIGGLSTCSGIRLLTVEVDDDDVAYVQIDDGAVVPDNGSITFSPPLDDVTATVVDFAGNESAAVVGGVGGCASMPTSTTVPMSLLAALLLLVRRRRASISMGERQ